MNDEFGIEGSAAATETAAGDGAAALQLALGSASRSQADAFLAEQTAIVRVQREHLHEQRDLQISHLKWRRFSDWMRAGWQAGLALLLALAAAALATALWDASHADGLVVDAFTVPPSFAQRGLGGEVIAADVTGRLAATRLIAVANSYSSSSNVSRGAANEIKVEIPDTGISIGEVWRYFRGWLGSERHLTGSLRENADGKIVLAASLDGAPPIAANGAPSDLPRLEQQLAENIFGAFDPVNHINYLTAMGRHRAAWEAAAAYVPIARSVLQRSDSYGLWSYTTAIATGDFELALERARIGIAIDPNLAVVHIMAARFCGNLGRDGCALHEARIIPALNNADQIPAHQGGGFAEMQNEARVEIARQTGDFAFARDSGSDCIHHCENPFWSRAAFAARMHDVSGARRLFAQAVAAGAMDPAGADEARYDIDAAAGNWASAMADASAARAIWMRPDGDTSHRFLDVIQSTSYAPMLAEAEAHAGQFGAAHAEIDRTPRDCVRCLTVRGAIDALQRDWGGAAWWLAAVARQAPESPFAYSDWGAMLLAKADYDGAIAKFAQAHEKGLHFADPLEMWGEALMQKNRSDLALTKFEEANKYAPNWGRLHLEWGKALMYVGRRSEAQQQFAIASQLDLSASDRVQIAKVSRLHG